MNQPFFSFVIPCCDVEQYVVECFQSVLNQSFQNWECIISIETSKDKTEEIIREKTAGDPRFRIFTGPRTGSCSESRNIGIDNAQGKYILFLDGDDAIAEGCLERLYERICARPGADLYPCAIITRNEIGSSPDDIRDNYIDDAPEELNGVDATLYLERKWHGSFCPMLQMTVFRREFLVENDLKCIRGLRCQDSEFSPRALYLAKRVVPLHEPFYLYRIRANSVQTTAKSADCFMKDWAIITYSLLEFYSRISTRPDFDPRVAPCWVRQWLSRMNHRWFSAWTRKHVSLDKRIETIQIIFKDGFDSHRRLLKFGSASQRLAGFWVRVFVVHPSMRWLSDLFFQIYFWVASMRDDNHGRFKTQIPGNNPSPNRQT